MLFCFSQAVCGDTTLRCRVSTRRSYYHFLAAFQVAAHAAVQDCIKQEACKQPLWTGSEWVILCWP